MEFIKSLKDVRSKAQEKRKLMYKYGYFDEIRQHLMKLILDTKVIVYKDLEDNVKGFPNIHNPSVMYSFKLNSEYASMLSEFIRREDGKYLKAFIDDICATDEYKGFTITILEMTDWVKYSEYNNPKRMFAQKLPDVGIHITFMVDLN
jgi:hypothetical protein